MPPTPSRTQWRKIWAHGKTLADITSPKSFALTLTRNRAIDIVRRRTFSELTDNLANQEVDTTDTDSIAFLHTAISSLPPVQQKVLRLSTYGELSAAEIARIMNLTPENIRQLLSRSRKKLRELFKKNL